MPISLFAVSRRVSDRTPMYNGVRLRLLTGVPLTPLPMTSVIHAHDPLRASLRNTAQADTTADVGRLQRMHRASVFVSHFAGPVVDKLQTGGPKRQVRRLYDIIEPVRAIQSRRNNDWHSTWPVEVVAVGCPGARIRRRLLPVPLIEGPTLIRGDNRGVAAAAQRGNSAYGSIAGANGTQKLRSDHIAYTVTSALSSSKSIETFKNFKRDPLRSSFLLPTQYKRRT